MKMPVITTAIEDANLSGRAAEIANSIVGRGGRLRSAKPKGDGEAAYVWRNLAFYISPKREHQCLPVMADMGIPYELVEDRPEKYNYQKVLGYCREVLDPIVDAIANNVPKSEWHGVHVWGRVLGNF